MRVAELVHPFVVEAGEQLPSAQLERLIEPLVLDEITERGRVDPQPGAIEADALARRQQRLPGLGAERSPDRPDRVAQARAGARVQHLGPETGGHVRPLVAAGVDREPREQRTRTP